MWRQDWFVIDRFKWFASNPHQFPDRDEHAALVAAGADALQEDDLEQLRKVTWGLDAIRFPVGGADEMLSDSNIVRA
jgi:molecular chaperone DnaK